MISKVFAVLDAKASCFMYPNFALNERVALRGFSEAIRSGKSDLSKYPEDYTLYLLGEFDDNTGLLSLPKSGRPEVVATAVSCVVVNPHLQDLPLSSEVK